MSCLHLRHTQKKSYFHVGRETAAVLWNESSHQPGSSSSSPARSSLCHRRGGCWHASTQTNACCLYSRGRPLGFFLTVALMLLCVTANFCCIGRLSNCFLIVSTCTEPPETTVCLTSRRSALLSLVSTKVYKACLCRRRPNWWHRWQ